MEQGFKAQLGVNWPLKELLAGKPALDLLFKGFKYHSEISFLKKIKKVMMEAFKDAESNGSELAQAIAMMGPLFSINSDVKVDLSHSDLEEILKHEHLSKANLSFDDVCKMMAKDEDIDAIKAQNFDLEDLGMSQAKLEKSGINMYSTDVSKCYHEYAQTKAFIDLMSFTPEDFQLDVSLYIGGVYSAEAAVRGKGLGQIVSQVIRACTFSSRERQRKSIHQDFLIANKLFNKHKDLYGEIPKY